MPASPDHIATESDALLPKQLEHSNSVNDIENTGDPQQVPQVAQQYGGIHTAKWIDRLPPSWIPYIQLSRLSPPVAITLIYFPHLFGALHAAASLEDVATWHLVTTCLSLLLGTVFFSNAAHAWNDLIDYPIDRLTTRTKKRPIPRGAITPRNAFFFTVSQGICAALVLFFLTPAASTAVYALPNILATMYYPFAKRHTHFVQVVLGFCLGYGVIMGSSAVGVNPVSINGVPAPPARLSGGVSFNLFGVDTVEVTIQPSTLLLFAASATWSVLYDTIYAHQDLEDDIRNGVKSLAVLFQSRTKHLLWFLLAIMTMSLVLSGLLGRLGIAFPIIAAGGSAIALGGMIWGVDLADSGSCWWWFKYGYWLTGLSITGGLLVEYLMELLF